MEQVVNFSVVEYGVRSTGNADVDYAEDGSLVTERGIGCLRVIILRVTGTTRLIEASSTRREVMRMEMAWPS